MTTSVTSVKALATSLADIPVDTDRSGGRRKGFYSSCAGKGGEVAKTWMAAVHIELVVSTFQ